MLPMSERRIATRSLTSHVSLVLGLAAGLSFASFAEAWAQQAAHHRHQADGQGHHGHGAMEPGTADRKVPAGIRHSGGRAHQASHGASASDPPAVAEYKAAHASMMRGMAVPYTGDPDADFRIQMIPHHQGAIDMARVAMRHAKDPWTRQLAEAVIVEQQREIAEMQAWLARHGTAVPQAGQPVHILGSNSYRSVPEEAGTRAEARGQSWAPGAGVPVGR